MSRLIFLLVRIQVFAASSSAVIALASQSNLPAVYEIDVSTRGNELVTILNSLLPNVAPSVNVPALALQTTLPTSLSNSYGTYRGIQNGTIYYIQAITQTTYNTLIIVSYLPTQSSGTIEYVVLPIEQIVDLLYFPTTFSIQGRVPGANPPPGPYISTTPHNTLIYYSVDPYKRAVDIISAYNSLVNLFSKSPNSKSKSQVWIQTTVNGPYNPALPVLSLPNSGLLQQVSSVTLSGNGLLAITFQTINQTITQTIYIPPEQVQQVIFIRNFNSPFNY